MLQPVFYDDDTSEANDMSEIIASYELNRSSGKKSSLAKGNEMISSNDRLHHMVKAELTNHLRAMARETDFSEYDEIPTFSMDRKCHVIAIIHPPTNRRMDAPNWYPTVKALIDGLTDAGVFEDDNNMVITSLTFVPGQKTNNKKYKIDLHIREGIIDIDGGIKK